MEKSIYEVAAEFNEKLDKSNYEFWDNVVISHHDGTEHNFKSAMAYHHDDWIIVFTKNHGYHVFYFHDLFEFYQYKRVHVPIARLPAEASNDL